MGQEPVPQGQQQSKSRRTPKITWILQLFRGDHRSGILMKASVSAMGKRSAKEITETCEGKIGKGGEGEEAVGEAIEKVRLLGCIVDPVSQVSCLLTCIVCQPFEPSRRDIKTAHSSKCTSTHDRLHLIDRFPTGLSPANILEEHGITGYLWFGPPGTRKTLVRALVKGVECRMLAVSPPDIIDMVSFCSSCPATASLTCSIPFSM